MDGRKKGRKDSSIHSLTHSLLTHSLTLYSLTHALEVCVPVPVCVCVCVSVCALCGSSVVPQHSLLESCILPSLTD